MFQELGFWIEFIELHATLSIRNIAFVPRVVGFVSEVGAKGCRLIHMGAIYPDLQ